MEFIKKAFGVVDQLQDWLGCEPENRQYVSLHYCTNETLSITIGEIVVYDCQLDGDLNFEECQYRYVQQLDGYAKLLRELNRADRGMEPVDESDNPAREAFEAG